VPAFADGPSQRSSETRRDCSKSGWLAREGSARAAFDRASFKTTSKGDVLVVDLRQVQSIVDASLVSESAIVKVYEHRQPLQQNLL
jgi:hypothetical protein